MKIWPLFLSCLGSIIALSLAVSATGADLSKVTVKEAVQRGVLGKLPAQFSLQDVSFTEVSRVDNAVTLKGEAVFAANEDTFVAVRRLGLKRPSGELNATIIRRVHAAGDTFSAPVQGVISVGDPAPRLVPQLTPAAHGTPRSSFTAAVIEGSPEHKRLQELDAAFVAADGPYQRVKAKWSALQELGAMLASYDAWAAVHPASIEGRIVRALDSKDVGKAYDSKVYRSKQLTSGQAKHAAFVQLVKPVFDPEYVRIKVIAETREAAAQAYVAFMEKL